MRETPDVGAGAMAGPPTKPENSTACDAEQGERVLVPARRRPPGRRSARKAFTGWVLIGSPWLFGVAYLRRVFCRADCTLAVELP